MPWFSEMKQHRAVRDLPSRSAMHEKPASRHGFYADLYVGVVTAIALWISTLVPHIAPIRAILGLIVGLFVPGYLMTALLFLPGKISQLERIGLSFTINIVIVIGTAFLMALGHIPLTAKNLTVLLSLLTTVLAAANFWLRKTKKINVTGLGWVRVVDKRSGANFWLREKQRFTALRLGWLRLIDRRIAAYLGSAGILIAITVLIVAHTLSIRSVAFSITSPAGELSGFPYQVAVGQRYPMTLHINNPHGATEAYVLKETANNRLVMVDRVRVKAKGGWQENIVLPVFPTANTMHVAFRLLSLKGVVVRQLWITYQITH